ncbi:GNAT family N-acetyltransferase [Lysinibacillus xylanilyticus]|uniref:GNAT family N-acetyltransferase n=1 Tax=Lysinibacillus xylanilyticus TaxID=582475 RepID=UPI00381C111F
MQIVTIEGVPYDWLKRLQEIHAHVFDGANLPLEKLESKEGLVCLLAVENEDIIGFKIGYTHPDGIFYSWLGGVREKKRGQGIASQLMRRQHEHLKPPADVTESERSSLCKHKADSGRNYASA